MIIAKYKFDKSIYDNLIPEFNAEFINYEIVDEYLDTDTNIVTRTITSEDLPTQASFGSGDSGEPTDVSNSLLSVLYLNTSNINNADFMFASCCSLASIDTSNWDTSKITNMCGMFLNCPNLLSLDVSNWDTSSVTNMYGMFTMCTELASLDVSNWDTSKVTTMEGLFGYCESLTSIDLSNWDISNVSSITYMFLYCSNLTSINISNWDLVGVGHSVLFSGCTKLKSIEIKNSNYETVNRVIAQLPRRTADFKGTLLITGVDDISQVYISDAESIHWNVEQNILIAKYTYHNYDFVPTFNDGFNYDYTDIHDSSIGIVTRTITSDTLPTFISFKDTCVMTVEYLNISEVTSMENMFYECTYLTSVNTSDWDTSNVNNMGGMFYNCNSLSSLDVSNWNTSKVTNMYGMFCSCPLSSLDVSKWDTSKVINMEGMFYYNDLTSLDVSNWNTNLVANMGYMFYSCNKLTSLDVSKWDTSSLTNTNHMFYGCSELISLDVSNWNTGNVTDMGEMFYNCHKLTSLDVSKWITNKVTNMKNMFYYCKSLTSLDLSNFDTSNVTDMYMMFRNCKYLTSLNISNWDINKVDDMNYMFDSCPCLALINLYECSKLTINKIISQLPDRSEDDLYYSGIGISKNAARNIDKEMLSTKCWSINKRLLARYTFNTDIDTIPTLSGVTGNDGMYYGYEYFVEDTKNSNGTTTRELFTFIETPPTRIYFSGCKGLKTLEYLYINNIKDMDSTFSDCTNLTSVNIRDWDTSKVTSMGWMFNGCSSLTSLDLSDWDTGNVTAMHSMFNGCSSLTSLNLSNWNVSQVESTNAMFEGCSSLTSLNLKYWDTGKVDDMRNMFNGCSKLTSLNLNSFNTNLLFDYGLEDMFTDCTSLSDLFLNNWNLSYSILMTNVFKNCSNLRYVNMINSNKDTVNKIVGALPSRTATSTGQIIVGDQSGISASGANSASKYWATLVQENNKFTFSADTFKYFIRSFKNRFALKSEVNLKVDKVEGKGLSTKDFTDSYCESCKNVLSSVQIGNVQQHYQYKDNSVPYSTDIILLFEQNNDDSYFEIPVKNSGGIKSYKLDINKENLDNIKFINNNGEEYYIPLIGVEKGIGAIAYIYSEPSFIILYDYTSMTLSFEFESPLGVPAYIRIPKYAGVIVPFDKYRPSGLIVGCDTNFVCEPGDEYRIYYKYATANPYLSADKAYGKHTLVAEITTANGQIRKEEVMYDSYDDIPNYYSYMPDTNDVAIKMYFVDMLGVQTGATYLKPTFKNFVVVYEFDTSAGHEVLPEFNEGYTDYVISNKTKNNSKEITLTSNSVPSSIKFGTDYFLTKATYVSQKLTNMSNAFAGCYELKETCVYGNKITDMSNMYLNCVSLIKTVDCGTNVINMSNAYANCYSLTGSPMCGNNVTNMRRAYKNCFNLIGQPVCGTNVIDMSSTYDSCFNLTGNPVCGPNVTTMFSTYYNCQNLTGSPVCGSNVISMCSTYYKCVNLGANGYFYSNNITNVGGCFGKKDNSKRLNVYVPNTGTTLNTIINNTTSTDSITWENITWTYDNTLGYGPRYYNTAQNIYVYPVENVANTHNTHNHFIMSYLINTSGSMWPVDVDFVDDNGFWSGTNNGEHVTITKTELQFMPERIYLNNRNIYKIISMSDSLLSLANSFCNCRNLTGDPVCGPNIINMYYAYYNCRNLTGSPVCGDKVVNMYDAYYACFNLTGSPVCGPNVKDMSWTYASCKNLTGDAVCGPNVINMCGAYKYSGLNGCPVCGNNVINMYETYRSCKNLTGNAACGPNVNDFRWAYAESGLNGSPACGDKVINMYEAYNSCSNLIGRAACGKNVRDMTRAFHDCYNLTGAACGNNVVYMGYAFHNCFNLTGAPACGPNVKDMSRAYNGCNKLTGPPACGSNVTNIFQTYMNCFNLAGPPACGPNVVDMDSAYYNCHSLTGQPACSDSVKSMTYAYCNCYNITGNAACGNNVVNMECAYMNCYNLAAPACGNNVRSMRSAYWHCYNLTGSPVCGNNVTNMDRAYCGCSNITGSPVCGPNVIYMNSTYWNCWNLTGSPVCGPNVTTISSTYQNCYNLTGGFVCGNKVTNMSESFMNCVNLTGPITLGPNVINAYSAFNGCSNLQGNIYIFSNNAYMVSLLRYTNTSLIKNIYVHINSNSLMNAVNGTDGQSIFYGRTTWINEMTTNNRYSASSKNVYVYPVNDVHQLYKENELGIVTYATTNLNERPVSMTGAIEGYGASINGNNVKLYRNSENDIVTHISFKGSTTLTSIVSMTDSITNMTNAFCDCSNLISRPMCGNNVITMDCAYKNCRSLTRGPIVGSNVTNMKETFNGCTNINGNGYIYSNKVNFASNCFRNRSNSKMLNLYVPITGYNATHNTLNAFLKTDASSIIGSAISWTNDTANNRYYNAVQNICIYPVNNVEQVYKENELAIAKYIVNGTNYYTTPVVQKEIVTSDGAKELVDIGITSESIDNGDGTRTVLVYSNDDVQPNKISFENMSQLLSIEKLKSDQVTNANYMFRGCKNLTSICNGNFELPNVETAVGIFDGCYKLQ